MHDKKNPLLLPSGNLFLKALAKYSVAWQLKSTGIKT